MAEDKKKVIVYSDWIDLFEALEDDEAGRLIKHFFRYINDLDPTSDRLTEISFIPIKQTLKRDLQSWNEKRNKNSQNGKLGGRPKKSEEKPTKANGFLEKPTKAKKAVSDSVSVSDNVILLEKETKEIDFSPFGDDFKIHWVTWTAYKKSQFGFRYKELKTEQMAFNDLVKKANSNKLHAISIINNSMVNGWKGLMPLKDVYPTFELHSQTHKRREIGTTKSMFE